MVLSFACPAARYSAKEARRRPRMAMTEPAHRPEVDRAQKGRGYPQVWSVDGFLDA